MIVPVVIVQYGALRAGSCLLGGFCSMEDEDDENNPRIAIENNFVMAEGAFWSEIISDAVGSGQWVNRRPFFSVQT